LVGRASHFKLQSAASIAKNILTTEATVAEAPEKQPAAVGGGMPDNGPDDVVEPSGSGMRKGAPRRPFFVGPDEASG
jgi:hypothetical protein